MRDDAEVDIQLFDPEAFSTQLHQSDNPLELFKQTLISGHQVLNEAFVTGIAVEQLVHKRAWFIDRLLIQAWRLIVNSNELALVAVGGYGRGELHPASDIDLMILKGVKTDKSTSRLIEKFLLFLWDIGLEVGHSVRTVKDCVVEAKQDITVVTNLMESRLLTGNKQLYSEMCKKTGPDKI